MEKSMSRVLKFRVKARMFLIYSYCIDYMELARITAKELGKEDWLDNMNHEIFDIAEEIYDLIDRATEKGII